MANELLLPMDREQKFFVLPGYDGKNNQKVHSHREALAWSARMANLIAVSEEKQGRKD